MTATQVKPRLIQPKRFTGHQKSADVIRNQPAYSIRARDHASQTEAECMAAISTWRTGIKKRLGKKGRPCMKRDTSAHDTEMLAVNPMANRTSHPDAAPLRRVRSATFSGSGQHSSEVVVLRLSAARYPIRTVCAMRFPRCGRTDRETLADKSPVSRRRRCECPGAY